MEAVPQILASCVKHVLTTEHKMFLDKVSTVNSHYCKNLLSLDTSIKNVHVHPSDVCVFFIFPYSHLNFRMTPFFKMASIYKPFRAIKLI